jgi:hypothetical protein
MSHDDRIRQLTDLVIEDLRGPVETSLRQLLAEMMGLAAQDRTAAIDEALRAASADHQAALEAALAVATQEREQALQALRAELSQRHEEALDALRADLGQQREQALDALRADFGQQHEQALDALRADLGQQREQALDVLRADLAQQHEQALDLLRTDLGERHNDALEAVRGELSLQRDELLREHDAALAAIREQATVEHDAALRDLVRNREETLEAVREQATIEREAAVQAVRAELGREYEAALDALREQFERDHAEEAERGATPGQHETLDLDARAAAEAAEALAVVQQERDAARASVAELADQLAAARAQHEQLTQLAHAESEAVAEMSAGTVEAHVVERQAELACTERVVAAMRALDEARTLTDILTVLADHAATERVRVAVLLVQNGRLRGWRFAGMGDAHAAGVDVPIQDAGVLGRVVETGSPASTADAKDVSQAALPSFLATPPERVGLALPILVGGRVVAVLYADNAGSDSPVVPSNWPEVAEVLARHAGRCLEVLTLSRAAAASRPQEIRQAARPATPFPAPLRETDEAQEEESARRHARLLISEIKLYNEELVERGRREGNLIALLGSEIDRARRLYEEKIPAAVRQRVDCFDEEIVRTLAGGDRTLLGQVT